MPRPICLAAERRHLEPNTYHSRLTALKTVPGRPISGWPAKPRCTALQFVLEELGQMRSHLIRERKLFHSSPAVVIRRQPAARFVWVSAQETKNRAPQVSGFALQVVKKINTKLSWMDIAFPSRCDGARVRTQKHPSAQQIPIDFVDAGYVKRLNLTVMHFHGQVRPHSLNWVTRQKHHV